MCSPQLLMMVGTAIMAGGQVIQGINAHNVANANARILRVQAENARARGRAEQQDEKLRTAAEKGQAAAQFGASGGEINTGSSAFVLGDIAMMGHVDATRIMQNAENEALFLETQAKMTKAQGDVVKRMGILNAAGTLMTGGAQVNSKWNVFAEDNPGANFTDWIFGRTTTGQKPSEGTFFNEF